MKSLLGRGASAFAETVAAASEFAGDDPRPKSLPPPTELPRDGDVLEGIPVVHPWIATARAVAGKLGRRLPYVLFLGASGEAFRIAYDRDDPEEALRASPVNTFLGALVIPGLTARAADGGKFEPALGGAEVALNAGLTVVLATDRGPAVLLSVDPDARRVELATTHSGKMELTHAELEPAWSAGVWPSGPAPYLRVVVEPLGKPRPLDDVARAGFETMLLMLTREGRGPAKTGLAAYEAWAEDLREDRIGEAAAAILHGEALRAAGIGRAAAARFLESVARAIPPERREPVEEAARCYARLHQLSGTRDQPGTGLYPELLECLTTRNLPDPALLQDEAVRLRAADLIDEIRTQEAEAVEHILRLPEDWRRA